MDLGRRPEARFLGADGGEYLRAQEVVGGADVQNTSTHTPQITRDDLAAAVKTLGEFGGDNRAGVAGTLHRISAIRNRKGDIVGLTCRVGRAVTGHIDMIRDIVEVPNSLLFLGRPGVGKTTVIREMARVLSDELRKRVVIIDTSNEIGGDGDVPHPAIGGARRMQVPDPSQQHRVMIEAIENHMPEVVIVDEIGTEAEALACRTIAERGVQLVGTAHGQLLENLMKNPTLSDLVGGVVSVTLGTCVGLEMFCIRQHVFIILLQAMTRLVSAALRRACWSARPPPPFPWSLRCANVAPGSPTGSRAASTAC